jgi:hypothetical protein
MGVVLPSVANFSFGVRAWRFFTLHAKIVNRGESRRGQVGRRRAAAYRAGARDAKLFSA